MLKISSEDRHNIIDKLCGSLVGFALGDAAGMALKEGHDYPHSAPIKGYPVADWSARTDQLILTIRSILKQLSTDADATGEVAKDLADRLFNWMTNGLKECGDNVGHGVSSSVSLVLKKNGFLNDPDAAAREICEQSNGNFTSNDGFLRACWVLPLTAELSATYASVACSVTHTDTKCVSSSYIVSQILHGILFTNNTAPVIMKSSIDSVRAAMNLDEYLSHVLSIAFKGDLDAMRLDDVGKTSHVYKTLSAVVYGLYIIDVAESHDAYPNYKKVIKKIAAAGGDVEANCAVVGCLLGAYSGLSGLPRDWVESLPHLQVLVDLIKKIVSRLMKD